MVLFLCMCEVRSKSECVRVLCFRVGNCVCTSVWWVSCIYWVYYILLRVVMDRDHLDLRVRTVSILIVRVRDRFNCDGLGLGLGWGRVRDLVYYIKGLCPYIFLGLGTESLSDLGLG